MSFIGASSATGYCNGATVIETDVPFEGFQIADPDVADGSTLSDTTVYLLGKRLGTTTLTLMRAESSDNTAIAITVVEYGN